MQFSMYKCVSGSSLELIHAIRVNPDNRIVTNLLIQSLRLQLNEQLIAVSFNDFDLEMAYLFALAPVKSKI